MRTNGPVCLHIQYTIDLVLSPHLHKSFPHFLKTLNTESAFLWIALTSKLSTISSVLYWRAMWKNLVHSLALLPYVVMLWAFHKNLCHFRKISPDSFDALSNFQKIRANLRLQSNQYIYQTNNRSVCQSFCQRGGGLGEGGLPTGGMPPGEFAYKGVCLQGRPTSGWVYIRWGSASKGSA